MSDIHDMCLVAMQLYLPEQYRIGTDLDQFTVMSQHMHINAFHYVWLGSNTYGLLESLPHDMMHAFLH